MSAEEDLSVFKGLIKYFQEQTTPSPHPPPPHQKKPQKPNQTTMRKLHSTTLRKVLKREVPFFSPPIPYNMGQE